MRMEVSTMRIMASTCHLQRIKILLITTTSYAALMRRRTKSKMKSKDLTQMKRSIILWKMALRRRLVMNMGLMRLLQVRGFVVSIASQLLSG